jgi:hypothetical protein
LTLIFLHIFWKLYSVYVKKMCRGTLMSLLYWQNLYFFTFVIMWVVQHGIWRGKYSQIPEHHIRHTSNNSVQMNKGIIGLQTGTFLNLRLLLLENAIQDKISFNTCNITEKNTNLWKDFILMGCKAVSIGN